MKKLLPIAFLILSACELILDVDVPRENIKLVVNASQRQDSVWRVDLTESKYILERFGEYRPVTNASITITGDDNSSIILKHDTLFLYKADVNPEPGRHYRIAVTAPGYNDVDAEFTMPPLIKITKLFIDSTRTSGGNGSADYFYEETPIEVTFTDPPGVENYYDLAMYGFYQQTTRDERGNPVVDTVVQRLGIYTNHPGLSAMEEHGSAFSDKTFDGQTITIQAMLSSGRSGGVHFEFALGHVSKEQYRYLDTRTLQFQTGEDPFSQPVQVYSNVNNGFGMFGGVTYDKIAWKAPKPD